MDGLLNFISPIIITVTIMLLMGSGVEWWALMWGRGAGMAHTDGVRQQFLNQISWLRKVVLETKAWGLVVCQGLEQEDVQHQQAEVIMGILVDYFSSTRGLLGDQEGGEEGLSVEKGR